MSLSPEDRDLLAASEEVRIETVAADGTVHSTIIWTVVDGEDVLIRSVNGDTARWYREALARPDVVLAAAGRRIAARVEPAADAESVDRCSAALVAKYRADPALGTMLRPHTLPTTLRLVAPA